MHACKIESGKTLSDSNLDYWVISYYHFVSFEKPEEEVARQKEFFARRDVKSRIYVSTQGINAQLSIHKKDAEGYVNWLSSRKEFEGVDFKIQYYSEHVFPRLTLKVRKELVALGVPVDMEKRGEYIQSEEWRKHLDSKDKDTIVLDVRNSYEWKLGYFEGAELFKCDTFKDFKESAKELKGRIDLHKTKVLMYCTGGIRCEIFSSLLKEEGIEKIYQLQGGVIRYGEEEKSKHWLGKLFVFDDRLSVPVSENETKVIGVCHHCSQNTERYYNCANMDCNELFLCCEKCLEEFYGCCKKECKTAKRVRPYKHAHKPFRKWYHYAKTKEELNTLNKKIEA